MPTVTTIAATIAGINVVTIAGTAIWCVAVLAVIALSHRAAIVSLLVIATKLIVASSAPLLLLLAAHVRLWIRVATLIETLASTAILIPWATALIALPWRIRVLVAIIPVTTTVIAIEIAIAVVATAIAAATAHIIIVIVAIVPAAATAAVIAVIILSHTATLVEVAATITVVATAATTGTSTLPIHFSLWQCFLHIECLVFNRVRFTHCMDDSKEKEREGTTRHSISIYFKPVYQILIRKYVNLRKKNVTKISIIVFGMRPQQHGQY